MKRIAIIPARGGSKRIPGKNLRPFCGKPIIAYSIETLLETKLFDEVMVSTDSEEIAEVARQYGASVPFMRSEATANDTAIIADVLKEVIDTYRQQGREFDHAVLVYATAPFVTAEAIRSGMETLMTEDCDSVLPIVQYSFPPQRSMSIIDGKVKYNCMEYANTRSQDLAPVYYNSGSFLCFKVDHFLENYEKNRGISENTVPVIVPERMAQDIDTEEDWEIAEIKYRILRERGK